MSSFKGKRWGIGGDARANKEGYIENVDKVIDLAAPQFLDELDINGSFEGQIRALGLLTDFSSFLMAFNDQLNSIEDQIDAINSKMELNNDRLLKKLSEIQEGA